MRFSILQAPVPLSRLEGAEPRGQWAGQHPLCRVQPGAPHQPRCQQECVNWPPGDNQAVQTPGRDPGKPCLSSSYRSSRTQSVHILVCPSIFKLSSCCLRAVFKRQRAFKVHTYIRSEPKILCLVTRTMSAVMTSGHAVMFWCTPDLIPNIQRIQQWTCPPTTKHSVLSQPSIDITTTAM